MRIERSNHSNYNVTVSNLETLTKNVVVKLNMIYNYFAANTESKKHIDILEASADDIKKALIGSKIMELNLDIEQSLALVKKNDVAYKIMFDLKEVQAVKDYNYNLPIHKFTSFKKGVYSINYKEIEQAALECNYFELTDKYDLKIYDEIAAATSVLLKYYPQKRSAIYTALGKTLNADLKPTYNTIKYLK